MERRKRWSESKRVRSDKKAKEHSSKKKIIIKYIKIICLKASKRAQTNTILREVLRHASRPLPYNRTAMN